MCGRQYRRRWEWRAPNREDLMKALEERQKDMSVEEANVLVSEISRDVVDAVLAKTRLRIEE